ncbi:hypothetical protein A2U01_0060544, partial [Trifolium medium]|nr:hypothetical protein [Trifolium medium]
SVWWRELNAIVKLPGRVVSWFEEHLRKVAAWQETAKNLYFGRTRGWMKISLIFYLKSANLVARAKIPRCQIAVFSSGSYSLVTATGLG